VLMPIGLPRRHHATVGAVRGEARATPSRPQHRDSVRTFVNDVI